MWLPDPSGEGKTSYSEYCLAKAWKDYVPFEHHADQEEGGEDGPSGPSNLPGGEDAVDMSDLQETRKAKVCY